MHSIRATRPATSTRPRRPIRLVAAIAGASVVVAGGTVLLLPHGEVPAGQHAHGGTVALPSAAPSPEATGESAVLPRLQFDPVALSVSLADAIAHDPTASQEPSSQPTAEVSDAQLLYRGADEGERITAGVLACVDEGAGALQLQYDLREVDGGWLVERRSNSGTPC